MNKLTEVQKQKIKEIVGKIYRDGIAENMTRQDIRINELYELFFSLLQKEREAGKREGIEILEGAKFPYEHYWPRAKQEQQLCETCNEVVERYTPCKASKHYPCWQALNSVIEKLKSLEKSNSLQEKLEIDDFKFDKKGNSIP